jgi:hypothetical protein
MKARVTLQKGRHFSEKHLIVSQKKFLWKHQKEK